MMPRTHALPAYDAPDAPPSDVELVAALVGTSRSRAAARRSAADLLTRYGGIAGLARLGARGISLLPGLDAAIAARLAAAVEFGLRCSERRPLNRPMIASSEDVVRAVGPRLVNLMHEQVWLLALDSRNKLVACCRVAEGGQHGCALLARDVVRVAVHVGASSFVLVHNHPGGDAKPSAQDIHLTECVAAASQCVGIPLLDHVVVSRSGHCSLLDLGLFSPSSHRADPTRRRDHEMNEVQ